MNQLQKYTWLIETIRRAGKISYKDLSDRWENNKNMSGGNPLQRVTFNRWREVISELGIDIKCQRVGGYLYYIANSEDIDEDKLKKWMLDSFAVGNLLRENLSLKNRILIDEIPSGRNHLTTMLEAMKEYRVVDIVYRPFTQSSASASLIEPYCLKLFENRWYVLARNGDYKDVRLYGLDRVERVEMTDKTFSLPKDFVASDYFANIYGVVIGSNVEPERIVIRAYENHKYYLMSLPLHHSQCLIEDCGDYADFELFLSPTYDFVMKLLQVGAMVEVIRPKTLRKTMKAWISDMYELYEND